jgi:hypothetical protein
MLQAARINKNLLNLASQELKDQARELCRDKLFVFATIDVLGWTPYTEDLADSYHRRRDYEQQAD